LENNEIFSKDLKNFRRRPARVSPRHLHPVVGALALLAAALWLARGTIASIEPRHDVPPAATGEAPLKYYVLALPTLDGAPDAAPAPLPANDPGATTLKVRSGDTLERLLRQVGVSPAETYRIARLPEARDLSRLLPGRPLRVSVTDGHVRTLVYEPDLATILRIETGADGYRVQRLAREFETRQRRVTGVIDSSLFEAGQHAGLPDALIMKMVQIFGWDIDFALDLRAGDRFTVIYEELYSEGVKVDDGAILAARFINSGHVYEAFRHVSGDDTDYFDARGMAMRKAFLRTPVEYTRISSRFTRARMHPILNRLRAHTGVDYAAPTGTPVLATADGTVVLAGNKGGYGRAIVLRHAGSYSTLYGHLSAFHRGVTRGARVRQGQVIGYVGQTGLATGPHLHYEFRINGRHVDPLTVSLPPARPIDKAQRATFLASVQDWQARLDRVATSVQVAAAH